MNAERLLAHFEQISEAPDAVARLRRFILDLAVRGKLVEQDPEDEPVEAYLRLINAKPAEQGDFRIPRQWSWVSVGEVSTSRLGKMLDKAKNKGTERPYLRNINVRWLAFDLSDLLEMRFEDSELAEYELRRGDVLICEGGEPGRAAVWDDRARDIYFQKAIHRVRFDECVDPLFFVHSLRCSAQDQRLSRYFTGTGISHFTGKSLKAYLFPLPPLAEQHRIVAKVDELMALCDQLEAARQQREQHRQRLVAATLQRLNQPAEDPATAQNDARFALQILPSITTTPAQIKQLRQTILDLAVRGRLVEQNPEDEPAEELLQRIAKERLQEPGRKKILTQIGESEKYLDTPATWTWVRLLGLGHTQTGTSPSSANPGFFGDEIPFIKPGDLGGGEVFYNGSGLSLEGIEHSRLAPSDSVMMVCIGATLGKVAKVTRPVCFNQQINSLTPVRDVVADYLVLALKSPGFQKLAWSKAGTGTLPIISKGKWEVLPIPLPPLAEQHRIVAKVEELMALCDQLEQQLSQADQQRRRLLEAVLAEALREPVQVMEGVTA